MPKPRYYQAVTHVSTNPARPSLNSVIGRELVHSRRYNANRQLRIWKQIYFHRNYYDISNLKLFIGINILLEYNLEDYKCEVNALWNVILVIPSFKSGKFITWSRTKQKARKWVFFYWQTSYSILRKVIFPFFVRFDQLSILKLKPRIANQFLNKQMKIY